MNKIAIISDIHGNLEALKSVLKDIEKRNIKTIYCLGNIIAKGVNSSTCLELVRKKCEIILRGNCDEVMCKSIEGCFGIEKERRLWNQSMLTKEQQEFLVNLPFCHEFYMSGSLIRLFHASPNSNEKFVANIDSIDKKRTLFLPSEYTISQNIADVVIYGHTHIQCLDRLYNRTIINVGSVGNPIDVIRNDAYDGKDIETTRANYLIIEGEYDSKEYTDSLSLQFIRVPYDINKELSSNTKNIERKSYMTELKKGKYRDPEKLKKSFEERNINIDII